MYEIGIAFYIFIFRIVALFHKKASKMVKGHRETWLILRDKMDHSKSWLWFHASSLGEFEQSRPIIEQIRTNYPKYGIIVTFYSPSGYEVRKNYAGADIVCYLPFDTLLNSRKFINLVKPKMAFFIKYEFWPNYLRQLNRRNVPEGHFSVLVEMTQLVIAPMEEAGYTLPENMLPDISEGKMFSKWLRDEMGVDTDTLPTYIHRFEDGRVVKARAYPDDFLPHFRRHLREQWIPEKSIAYFASRDPEAIQYLPALYPKQIRVETKAIGST